MRDVKFWARNNKTLFSRWKSTIQKPPKWTHTSFTGFLIIFSEPMYVSNILLKFAGSALHCQSYLRLRILPFRHTPLRPVNRAERPIFCRSEAFSGPQTSQSRLRWQFTCWGCRKVYILVPFLLGTHYFGPTWQAQTEWQVVIRLDSEPYSTILAASTVSVRLKWPSSDI